jgi:hypothetical protein
VYSNRAPRYQSKLGRSGMTKIGERGCASQIFLVGVLETVETVDGRVGPAITQLKQGVNEKGRRLGKSEMRTDGGRTGATL